MNAAGHSTRFRPEYRELADHRAPSTTASRTWGAPRSPTPRLVSFLFSPPLYRCERIILPSVPALGPDKQAKGGSGKCANPCRCQYGQCLGSIGANAVGLAGSAGRFKKLSQLIGGDPEHL